MANKVKSIGYEFRVLSGNFTDTDMLLHFTFCLGPETFGMFRILYLQ